MTNTFKQMPVLTNLYISCGKFRIQITILYKRGDFLWVGDDEYKLSGKKFGDFPRSINK